MSLAIGTKLGPYEILATAGSGGMGEVYRARDTRLDRIVAVKVLPEGFAADASRLRRFEQESRSIAALSHSNIVAVHDVGLHEGSPYLIMEFLEGKTLRERLNEGALPVGKAVELAQQIARGLAAAHERGIIHRDLKPENIFITRDGSAKLLDFGLAKPAATAAAADATAGSATSPGVVMGTAGYMSPEQVRGEAVDHRADIFAFGAVLYEMLGGKRAFAGDTSVEVMTAILKSEPPEFDPAVKISPGLDRIIRHCLEKSAADRFQTARDLSFALGALSGTDSSTAARTAMQTQHHPKWMNWVATALAIVAVAALAALLLRPHATVQRMQFAIPVEGEVAYLGLSPDGEMLAYVATDDTGMGALYVQRVGESSATRLEGTDGATYPFWSPDHKFVGFFADGKMKKVATSGGVPQVLAKVTSARGGSWGTKDVIIYCPEAGGPLWRINADGTAMAPLTKNLFTPNDASHRFPVFLPDGEHFLFWSGNFNELPDDKETGIYFSSLAAKTKELVVSGRSSPGYSQGKVFYVDSQNALVSLPIDSKGKATGQPQVMAGRAGLYPSTYWAAFSIATNGTLIYGLGTGAPLSQLTWYDRSGKELSKLSEPGILANPNLSPDDNWVAVDVADLKAKNIDVWIENVAHGTSSRFTFDPSEETNGVWSRDGSMIAYRSAGMRRLAVKKSRGLDPEQVLITSGGGGDTLPTDWTPDGKQIMVASQASTGGEDIDLVGMDGKVTPFLDGPASETNGQISPDGKWVIYASNESGDWEIYATTFPTPGGKIQISRGGGTEPRWRSDGKEIFYVGPRNMLTAVALNVDATLSTGTPQPLFQLNGRAPISSTDLYKYDVGNEGNRFLVNRYMKPATIPPLNIILNATAN
jgi:eukaryotic-like serine/threonine-protein kinase